MGVRPCRADRPRSYRWDEPLNGGHDPHTRISALISVRRTATRTLGDALRDLGTGATEMELAARWHQLLGATARFRADGWYIPPPQGIAVLIAKPPAFDRADFPTLRSERYWPRSNVRLSDDDVLCAYASPIDRDDPGLIGDVGVTLYRGADVLVREHLARCLHLIRTVVSQIEVGMTLGQVNALLSQQIAQAPHPLRNRILSPTDPNGTNIGHTIPWSNEPPTPEELALLTGTDDQSRRTCISHKRQFVNAASSFEIPPTIAFTIEPRLASPVCPTAFFHCIVVFRDGTRSVHSGYRALFEALEVADRFDADDVAMLDDETVA